MSVMIAIDPSFNFNLTRYPLRWPQYSHLQSSSSIRKASTLLSLYLYTQPSDRDFIAGTMFELTEALHEGANALRDSTPNPISLNAGCELFIAFVTLCPHDSDASF
jgi:translation initiation factor eIF-2B subunit alpha